MVCDRRCRAGGSRGRLPGPGGGHGRHRAAVVHAAGRARRGGVAGRGPGNLGLEPKPLVVAGRIGGKGIEPFLEGKASFSLLEIPADDHAAKPGHNADDCPFCKKRQANATMAAVQFLGADGKPIPVDARKLFGVEKGQDVVIRGTGVFDAKLGVPIIQVTADGIFVRPLKK